MASQDNDIAEIAQLHVIDRGHLLDDVEALRALKGYYIEVKSWQVPWRIVGNGLSSQRAWNGVSLLIASTNSINKNGHLYIEHLLSKHLVYCIQKTKFGDAQHLSTFNYHLDSSFKHKLFVNDPNALLDRPNRDRSSWSDDRTTLRLPGFRLGYRCITLVCSELVPRCEGMVELVSIYIHNVLSPVDRQAAILSVLGHLQFKE
ncbi:hypothetical protein Plhal703r1_c07g0041461 [Plasmopara halstedii]